MAMAGCLRSGLHLLRQAASVGNPSTADRSVAPPDHLRARAVTVIFQFARNYARATPSKPQKVKVHLKVYGVSGNYATALYIAAVKAHTPDKVESERQILVEAAKKSPIFSEFMKDLSVTSDTRVKALTDICDEAKFSEITKYFLR